MRSRRRSDLTVVCRFLWATLTVAAVLALGACGKANVQAPSGPEAESAENLRALTQEIRRYADENKRYPATLAELRPRLGNAAYEDRLLNPWTGAQPGYLYQRPPANADPANTVVLLQIKDGQPLENAPKGYLDGTIH